MATNRIPFISCVFNERNQTSNQIVRSSQREKHLYRSVFFFSSWYNKTSSNWVSSKLWLHCNNHRFLGLNAFYESVIFLSFALSLSYMRMWQIDVIKFEFFEGIFLCVCQNTPNNHKNWILLTWFLVCSFVVVVVILHPDTVHSHDMKQ